MCIRKFTEFAIIEMSYLTCLWSVMKHSKGLSCLCESYRRMPITSHSMKPSPTIYRVCKSNIR